MFAASLEAHASVVQQRVPLMTASDVLLVAGTHGNEVNAPWLLDEWQRTPELIDAHGLTVQPLIGNPDARAANRRYIDRDLNRSFLPERFASDESEALELARARSLVQLHGPHGTHPCRVALDLHSTTAAMGSCLVVYGRRPADLALASLVQGALGLPVYLHEADDRQTGFLVECWPCGLVIEVGPVPQSLLDVRIVEQTRLAVETCLASLAAARRAAGRYPRQLVVHRHRCSLDLPRRDGNQISGLLHGDRLGRDWQPLASEDPLFVELCGQGLPAIQGFDGEVGDVPVFINEAAYAEKRIALSLTRREVWPVEDAWRTALEQLLKS